VKLPVDAPRHEEHRERDGFARRHASCWRGGQLEGAGLFAGGEDYVREDLFQGLVVLVRLDLDALHVGGREQGAEPFPGLLVFFPDPGAGSDILVLGCGAECQLKDIRVPQLPEAGRALGAKVLNGGGDNVPSRGDTCPGCQVVDDRDSCRQHVRDG
jgi:hypothetical protein